MGQFVGSGEANATDATRRVLGTDNASAQAVAGRVVADVRYKVRLRWSILGLIDDDCN